MVGVDEDDLVVLVHTVLVDPVRVKHTQVAAPLANTLLRNALETPLGLEVVDTLADGLAEGGTLGGLFLAVTAADTDPVDHVALLGLVAQPAGLVGARGARRTVDDVQLAVLPAPAAQKIGKPVKRQILGRSTYRTRRRNRRTSDCFFLYSSPMYLYAPMLRAGERGESDGQSV